MARTSFVSSMSTIITGVMTAWNTLIYSNTAISVLVWDPVAGKPAAFDVPTLSYERPEVSPPLTGRFKVRLADGSMAECTTVWELLWREAERYTPEEVEKITWVPAARIREAGRMFATTRPGNFFSGWALDAIGVGAGETVLYSTGREASFAFLPGAIVMPHYDEFPEVMVTLMLGRRPPGTYLIGIDGHTALVGVDHTWQVLGAGRVTVRRGRAKQRYAAGQSVALNS